MSGDLAYVQNQLATTEFVDKIKSLSVAQPTDTHGDAMEGLLLQLKRAIPNGLKENKPFAFSIVDNFYRLVPILDTILSKDEEEASHDFIQAQNFLQALAKSFNEICFLDLFTNIKDVQKLQGVFRSYIVLIKEKYFTDHHRYDNLLNCLLPTTIYSGIFISITEDYLPPHLLTYLLAYTKQYWQCRHRERIIRGILALMKVLSKKPALVPMIIRAEWPQACVQWLLKDDSENFARPSFDVDYLIYLIIQKLARHTAAVQVLNQLNCLTALDDNEEQIRKDHTSTQADLLKFLHCMIYALLTEADGIKQISLLNDNQMCHALDQLVSHTIDASRNELFSHGCFHISEMLSVLSKLFVNDDILIKCIDENNQLFDCLCQLVIHFTNLTSNINRVHLPTDDETLVTVTNLLWSISFHQSYQEQFRSNSMLMHTLSNLAASASFYASAPMKSIPRDLCSLKKAAEGIIWNLKSSSGSIPNTLDEKNNQQQQPLAMISYSHSDSTFCRELVERLSTHVPVWVDYKQAHDAIAHSDDLWEEIARAMEMASVIILIISKEYYDSKSCRQELSYATDALKKRIVPIYAPSQKYRASGWLGIRIAGQKYIHFGRKLFTEAVKELAAMVDTDQKQIVVSSPPPPTLSAPAPAEPTPSSSIPEEETKLSTLKTWTTKDVRQWFEENRIHTDLITLYADQFQTGTALIIYARHLKLFYRHEYIRIFTKYQKLFHEKTLDTFEFITFVDALYRLRMEHDPDWSMEDSLEKSNEQRIPYSMKSLEEGMTWL